MQSQANAKESVVCLIDTWQAQVATSCHFACTSTVAAEQQGHVDHLKSPHPVWFRQDSACTSCTSVVLERPVRRSWTIRKVGNPTLSMQEQRKGLCKIHSHAKNEINVRKSIFIVRMPF